MNFRSSFILLGALLVGGFLLTGCPPKKRLVINDPPVLEQEEEELMEGETEGEGGDQEGKDKKGKDGIEINQEWSEIPSLGVVQFGYDAARVTSEMRKTLKTNVAIIKKLPKSVKIRVEGHCDDRGTVEYNIALGQRRANAIRSYYFTAGIPKSRIQTISFGEERPVCNVQNDACWKKNRRGVTKVRNEEILNLSPEDLNNMRALSLFVLGASFAFVGCVTREDIRGLQTDIYLIQQGLEKRLGNVKSQTDNVQTSQADLLLEIQTLSENLEALKTDLTDYQTRMKELSVRLDDLEAALVERMNAQIELLSGSKFVDKPLPSTVYNLANNEYSRGRYAEAIKGFKDYVEKFPKGEGIQQAKLLIAESYAKKGDSKSALRAYDEVIKIYEGHPLVVKALFGKGLVLEKMDQKTAAKNIYGRIIKEYPYRPEQKLAKERIDNLRRPK